MSDRAHLDRSPLGYSSDPVPGDAAHVAASGKSWASSADTIQDAAVNLTRLESPGTCSEAITKIMNEAHTIAGQLASVQDRYRVGSQALLAYAPVLERSQQVSLEALSAATQAKNRAHEAHARAQNYADQARGSTDQVQASHYIEAVQRENNVVTGANGDLASARSRLLEAIHDRDSAADSAANRINDAVNGSPVNDSAWDKFQELAAPVVEVLKNIGKWIWDNIDAIAMVLMVLAAVCAPIPIVGQVLAVLAMGAKILSMVKLAYTASTAIATGVKTGNWGPALMSVGMMAVAKFAPGFIGKVAGKYASKAVTGAVTKYNSWLKSSVQKQTQLIADKQVLKLSQSFAFLERKVTRGDSIPGYHAAAADLEKIYSARNPWIDARRIDAVVSATKGTDYAVIRENVDELARLSQYGDISAEAGDAMADAAGRVAGRAAHDAADEAIEAIRDGLGIEDPTDTHREIRQECGA